MAAKKKKKKLAPKKKPVAKKKKAPVAKKKAAPAKKKKAAPAKKKAVAKRSAAKKKNPAAKRTATKRGVSRRDRPGHIDPTYGKQLREKSGRSPLKEQQINAFRVKDDDVAEDLGEELVAGATSGENEGEDVAQAEYVEEVGGPFVVTSGGEEFAEGTDESNPPDAEAEPFPKT